MFGVPSGSSPNTPGALPYWVCFLGSLEQLLGNADQTHRPTAVAVVVVADAEERIGEGHLPRAVAIAAATSVRCRPVVAVGTDIVH